MTFSRYDWLWFVDCRIISYKIMDTQTATFNEFFVPYIGISIICSSFCSVVCCVGGICCSGMDDGSECGSFVELLSESASIIAFRSNEGFILVICDK